MKHYNDVINQVKLISEEVQDKRPERPFTQLEMALAYSAYAIWHSKMELDSSFEKTDELIEPIDGAREVALRLLEHIKKHPSLTRAIKRKFPGYLSYIEYKWALEESERPEWKISLSRGILLLSMELARVCISSGKTINTLEELSAGEEIEIARTRLSNILGREAALGIFALK